MKKIFCIISPNYFFEEKGGAEWQAYLLGRELVKQGWNIHYIRERQHREPLRTEHNFQLHAIPKRHTKLKWLNLYGLYHAMKPIKADYWYCRGTISYVFPVWLISRIIGGKIIFACSHDSQVSETLRKGSGKGSLANELAFLLDRFLFKIAIKRLDGIVVQTRFQQQQLWKNHHCLSTVIYNGHDIPDFPVGIQKENTVLWIARLQPWKQPQLFIELLKGICNKPYRFCAIGRASGQEHYEKLFKKAETEYPQFSYLGEISHQQVLNLLQQAKLLVSTAESEGFSNTFIEAWLCGVPVLSLTVDPDDLIKVEKLGKITSDIEQMQQELEKFMTDDTYYLQYSNHCRTFAEKNFNISQTVSQLEKLLNSLQ